MQLKNIKVLELPPSADMHVHLRQGAMMHFAVSQIRSGGVDTVMVRKLKELIVFNLDKNIINTVILFLGDGIKSDLISSYPLMGMD